MFFDLAEVQWWMQDLPRMESHVLDAGHFLLETEAVEAARLVRRSCSAGRGRVQALDDTISRGW